VPLKPLFLCGWVRISLLLVVATIPESYAQDETFDWRLNWAVEDGFFLESDSEGYQFPTAIAFVPEPGAGPDDPLYFVTELRGTVKVVTNDRTVRTYAADFFDATPTAELPAPAGEFGMAGICLDAKTGYVFVTYAYWDDGRILRNNISRFQSTPGSFSVRPTSRVDFTDVFAADEAAVSHQIGGCQVDNGLLYVGVADGLQTQESQSLDSLLGKIIRLTFDGKPAPGNPFLDARLDKIRAADYIWASGLRNPFGLKVVDGRVFATDNGFGVDRFIKITGAENYLWDGTDWSTGTKAAAVFSPAVSPVHMDYYDPGMKFFTSEYDSTFFVAFSGSPEEQGPGIAGDRSIVRFGYDFRSERLSSAPRVFLKYIGKKAQMIVGLAFGRDGLYFAPLFPEDDGKGRIYKVAQNAEKGHPVNLLERDPEILILKYGCRGCHRIAGSGGNVAPSLDTDLAPRVLARVTSEQYRQAVAMLPQEHWTRYPGSADAIEDVASQDGLQKVRAWVARQIEQPGFDRAQSQMPNLAIPKQEAGIISDYIVREAPSGLMKVGLWIGRSLRPLRLRHVIYAYALGVVSMAVVCAVLAALWRKRTSR
jgi:glucose/arabinose dehydrogenase